MKLLIVEDEKALSDAIVEYLTSEGYGCETALNFWAADEKVSMYDYDCVLVDISLPDGSGFGVIEELKKRKSEAGIIIISAKNSLDDKITGLEIGADDYMTKPFSMEELLARLQAVLRRSQKAEDQNEKVTSFQIKDFIFDSDKQTLTREDEIQKLTVKESKLLTLLCENMGKSVSRSYALKMVWGDDTYFNARSMDVYITKLRKFLKEEPDVQIVNVHGEGFKLVL